MVKISDKHFDTNIVQIYLPTIEYEDREINITYEEEEKLVQTTKRNESTVVNAKVGKTRENNTVGSFG